MGGTEEHHYYAFGLKIAGISSEKFGDPNEGMLDNKNLYNDKELFDEADLDWYDYGFRNYDPQIGRFPQLDPLTDDYPHYTPFQYAGNEPIANVDLDGLEEFNALQTLSTVVIDGSHVAKSATNIASHALYASVLSLSSNFINPNISESTCIPCASQKQYMEATGKQIQNNVLPKSTIGPDNYIASPQEQAINTQKMSDAGYVNGNLNFLGRAAQNRTWNNFANNTWFPMASAAVGEGVGKIAFEGAGYFLKGAAGRIGDIKVPIYRVYGNGTSMYGKSYSLINPKYFPFYRNLAGLPTANSGEYLLKGMIQLRKIKIGRWFAAPLQGKTGGLPFELYQNYNQLSNPVNIILKKPF